MGQVKGFGWRFRNENACVNSLCQSSRLAHCFPYREPLLWLARGPRRRRAMSPKPNRARPGRSGRTVICTSGPCPDLARAPGSRTASRKSMKPSGPRTSSGRHPGSSPPSCRPPTSPTCKGPGGASARTRLEDVRIHDLRHSCATRPDRDFQLGFGVVSPRNQNPRYSNRIAGFFFSASSVQLK